VEVFHSIITARAIADEVLTHYDLGGVSRCELLSHNQNDLFLVVGGRGRFVLRVSPARDLLAPRSTAGVAYELDLLGHLAGRGFPCPRPLSRRDGRPWCVLEAPEGPRVGVLFGHVMGNAVGSAALDPEVGVRYGRLVASFHTIADGLRSGATPPQLSLERLMERPLELAEPVLAERQHDLRFLRGLSSAVRERLADIVVRDVGPCHGDLTGGNLHANGSALALLDFEWCGVGLRAYDLAVFRWTALIAQHLAGWTEERSEAVWAAFLRGYQGERGLDAADLAAIAPFTIVRHFWFLGLRAANRPRWGQAEVNPAALDWMMAFFREEADRQALSW
jgi:Ser/Thr protein kinase RdoA (MazF antagonist)